MLTLIFLAAITAFLVGLFENTLGNDYPISCMVFQTLIVYFVFTLIPKLI